MSALRAILFDIDDTLFSTTEIARHARRNAVEAMIERGLKLDADTVLRELDEVISEFGSNYAHHYEKLLQRLPPEALAGLNPSLVISAGIVSYHDTKFQELKPFADVAPLLADLRAAGMHLGVVTHGWTVKQAEKLVRLRLLRFFDPLAVIISEQVGISKPNPKLYAKALRELDLPASEVLYVGDNPTHDIAPPQSLGMRAAWIKRAAKHDLAGTGIQPDHVVEDFEGLRTVLREVYGIAV
ncbi:MAG: TIGR02253 family HAD-type hydrolase [Planctomycetota bacterium]|nr:TIGR02253 family HAD-type hydrolase [Planctomycetota bacterium]